MANFFDQFDAPTEFSSQSRGTVTVKPYSPAPATNFFDQFDAANTPQASREPEGPPRAPVGMGEALGRGVRQGTMLNFGDEISGLQAASGLPQAAIQAASMLPGGGVMAPVVGAARLGIEYLTGGNQASDAYNRTVEAERERNRQAQEERPYSFGGGQVLGAVALPVGGALNAATLPVRMARGAAVGGSVGAVSGAGEGEEFLDRAGRATTGAVIGGTIGGVAPPIVEGSLQAGRAAVNPLVNAVRGATNPEAEAARRVATAITRDVQTDPAAVGRLTPQEFAASAQNGGPARIMDIGGETTRGLARSAANTSPEGRQALNAAINDRFEGQVGRVVGWLRQTFNYPNAHAQREALEQAAGQVNNPAYRRAMQEGSRGVWSPELQRLAGAPAIQEAANSAVPSLANRGIAEGFRAPRGNPLQFDRETGLASLRRMPNGNEVVPDLRFWDQVKRGLGSMISKAERNADDAKVQELTQLRNLLVARLDDLVPSYQQARAGAAHFFGAEDALTAGQNFVTANMRQQEFRQAFARMNPTERQLFQDGFVSRFIETLERTPDRRSVLNQISNSPAAREKLNMVLGPQRAAELEAGLRVEGIMDLARGAVQGNSTTVRQLAEIGFAGGAGAYGVAYQDPQAMTISAVSAALIAGRRGIDTRVAQRVAEMLVSNDPRQLARGIQLLARNGRMMDNLRIADRKIATVGGSEAPVSITPIQSLSAPRAEDQSPNVNGPRRQ